MMIAWIRKQIRMYFGFSKKETNGVLLLLLITTITILVPFAVYCYDRLYRTAEREDIDDKNNLVIVESEFYQRREGDRLKKYVTFANEKYTMQIVYQWSKSPLYLDGPAKQIANQLPRVGLEVGHIPPDLLSGEVMSHTASASR